MKKRIGVLLAALVVCLLALSVTALAADAQVEIHLRTVTASTRENMVIPKEQLVQMKLTQAESAGFESLDGYYRKDAAGNWIFYDYFSMPAPSDLTDAAAFISDNYNTLRLGNSRGRVTLPLTAFQWTALEADPPLSKTFSDSNYLLTADLCVYQVRFAKNDGTTGLYDGADYTHYAIKGSVCSSALPAAPTREGYTFDGWYTAAEGGTRATPKNLSSLLTPEADVTTLYAHWTQSSAAEHTHCICGGTHKDIGDHDAEEIKTFTAWNDPATLPSDSGCYYLACDVLLNDTWIPADGVVLCLNGFSIISTDPSNAIYVGDLTDTGKGGPLVPGNNQRTFTLADCKGSGEITHRSGCEDGGVWVTGSGTFKMFGGSIAGNLDSGVLVCYVQNDPLRQSTFIMYGGRISGNSGVSGAGGVDTPFYGSSFTMYGGEISGNSAKDGGGVFVGADNTFTMCGGKICGNSAERGGGVFFNAVGTLIMSGGEITGNNATEGGGGVHSWSGRIRVSGSVRITDNVTGGTKNAATGQYTGGKTSNVYLGSTSKIAINDALTDGAHIGVALGTGYSKTQIFTSGWSDKMGGEADPAAYFSSDDAVYHVKKDESGEAKLVRTAQRLTFDLNSLIAKQLTSDVPFEKLSQTEFTLTFSGGRSHVDADLGRVYDWQLTTTAKATITAGSMTENDGVYTASAPFLFTDNSAQEGAYSLQDGLLTIMIPAELTSATFHEFTITETDDGTAGMTYSTSFSHCNLTSEIVIDPRTGMAGIAPKSMAWSYTENEDPKSGELAPELTNGVYRFPSGGMTIRNSYTYVAPAPDDPGDLIVPAPKQDKGLLNKDDHTAYLTGYPDGTVRPDGEITRAEVASIFYRLLRDEARTSARAAAKAFSDVPAGKWYHDAVTAMAGLGIVTGYPDGTFRPDQSITRAEFAAILARIEQTQTGADAGFTDVAGHWAAKQIGIACAKGWATGYADGTFRPDRTITRAEAVAMTNRLLERRPESEAELLPGMRTWTDNADPAKWYYLDLQEATNGHTYTRRASGYELWQQLKN